jgi:orotidine-5'-phosphate decarboxylase
VDHFTDRLIASLKESGAPVCVGIDPQLALLPAECIERAKKKSKGADDGKVLRSAVRRFCEAIIDESHAAGIRCVKPNVAFFEQLGPRGLMVFERVCRAAQKLNMAVIADIKRGDMGSTAEAYADAWLGSVPKPAKAAKDGPPAAPEAPRDAAIRGVDAVTINPYLGTDSLLPFTTAATLHGKGVFVLLKTSNPGSADLQDQQLASGGLLQHQTAALITKLGASSIGAAGYSNIGAVVGATHPAAGKEFRTAMPQTFFLIPGYGAQGGSAEGLRGFFRPDGTGGVVNSSRGVIHAYNGPSDAHWRLAIREAAKKLIADVGGAVKP